MNSAVCTLFEGHYHYGVAALANSLHANGFRGTIYVGYRGLLPHWAGNLKELDGAAEFSPIDGLTLRFIALNTKHHFTHYKPNFMLDVWEKHCPQAEYLFYFDPDIVVRCRWSFYEEWGSCGVALCQEITNANLSSNHPFRFKLKIYAKSLGFDVKRELSQLFNGGYIGVCAKWKPCLGVWKALIQGLPDYGIPLDQFSVSDPTCAFNVADQMMLNLMAMVADCPLSTVGPEEMDFLPGGSYMSHASGSPKPWRKKYIRSALCGTGPSRAEKAFWRSTQFPIELFSKSQLLAKQFDLKTAAAISRFIRRN
jgi:hypothetical protein